MLRTNWNRMALLEGSPADNINRLRPGFWAEKTSLELTVAGSVSVVVASRTTFEYAPPAVRSTGV